MSKPRYMDLTGQRFGRLLVLEFAGRNTRKEIQWKCQCDCGCVKNIPTKALRNGSTQSCGCYNREMSTLKNTKQVRRHDLRVYKTWQNIKRRCSYEQSPDYKYYGGSGIKVCDEWINDFPKFYEWAINSGYNDSLTIERIDYTKDYCPENCCWKTVREQCNNRRTNHFLEIKDEKHTISEWSRLTGINERTLRGRVQRGWAGENLISPVKETKRRVI